jgi:hypothetical protein
MSTKIRLPYPWNIGQGKTSKPHLRLVTPEDIAGVPGPAQDLPKEIVLQFVKFDDPDTLEPTYEVKAINPDTYFPVHSDSILGMTDWLKANGYECRLGTLGVWELTRK